MPSQKLFVIETSSEAARLPDPRLLKSPSELDAYLIKRDYSLIQLASDETIVFRVSPEVLPRKKMERCLAVLRTLADGVAPDGTLQGEAQQLLLQSFSRAYGVKVDEGAAVSVRFLRTAFVGDGNHTASVPYIPVSDSLIEKHRGKLAKPVQAAQAMDSEPDFSDLQFRLDGIPALKLTLVGREKFDSDKYNQIKSDAADQIGAAFQEYEDKRRTFTKILADAASMNDDRELGRANIGGRVNDQPKELSNELKTSLRGNRMFADQSERDRFVDTARVQRIDRRLSFGIMVSLSGNNRPGFWSLSIDE